MVTVLQAGLGPSERSAWLALVSAGLLAFSMWGQVLMVSSLLQPIKRDFELSFTEAGLLFALPTTLFAITAMPGGVLADRLGIRNVAALGAGLAALGGLLRSFAPNFHWLLGFTILMGIGWGFAVPNIPKLVSLRFSAKLAGTTTGIFTSGLTSGATVGVATAPLISPPIPRGWSTPFLIWGAVTAAAALLWWVVVREPKGLKRSPSSYRIKDVRAVLGLRNVWLSAMYFLLAANVTFYTALGWYPTWLTRSGMEPLAASFLVATIPLIAIPSMLIPPWISDRVGYRRPFLLASGAVQLIPFLLSVFLPVASQWYLIPISAIGMSASFSLSLVLPVDLVHSRLVGSAGGLVLSIGRMGGLLGPWLAGLVWDLTGAFTLTLLWLAAVSLASILVAMMLPETGPKGPQANALVAS